MNKKHKKDVILSERHYVLGDRDELQGIVSKETSTYKITDSKIESNAYDLIHNHTEIDASGVRVNVTDGVVTLNGYVKFREHKKKIEELIGSILGVGEVNNQLEVKLYSQAIAKNPTGLI